MKSPPVQYTDDEARRLVEQFIAGEETVGEKLSEALMSEKKATDKGPAAS